MKKERKLKTKTITFKDLTGQKFGKLTVLKLDHIQNRTRFWLCECDCELHNKKIVKERYLIEGQTQSCGCLKSNFKERFIYSGAIITEKNRKLYDIWKNTYHRCYNIENKKYKEYGAKGITICEEWQDFNVFCNWCFENGYREGLALIRKNIKGNYEPNNCVWDLKANYHRIQKEYGNLQIEQEQVTEPKIIQMKNYIKINNNDIKIIEYNNKRVISLNDIAKIHQLENRNVKDNFNNNKKYFVEGEDYFILTKVDYENIVNEKLPKYYNAVKEIIIFTEQGYLLIAKTFSGDLAWKVQKQLINCYFKIQELKTSNEVKNVPAIQKINSIEILENIVSTFKQQQGEINNLSENYNKLKEDHEQLKNKIDKMIKAIS